MPIAEVSGLFVYPVKSMRRISLHRATLGVTGLANDRRFMVVRDNGKMLTQRDNGRLALVHQELHESGVSLSLQGHGTLDVPFDKPNGRPIRTAVWDTDCEVRDMGDEIAGWLSAALQSPMPLRLVRMDPDFTRPQSEPEMLGADTATRFADAAPYLVANEASLAALNTKLESRGLDAVPMNRFRPNIVVRGLPAFAEQGFKEFATGDYRLKLCGPCERCVVTTIDQDTGLRHPDRQPFRTLVDINPLPDKPRAPAFAQYAVLASGAGQVISVGDALDKKSPA